MTRFHTAIVSMALLFCLPATVARGQQPVVLNGAFTQALHSTINGVDYQLTIVLPPGYERMTDKRYPALYVMDGNRWSQLLAVIYPRLMANAGYPPIIFIGVDYPGKTGRYQDYGPVSQRYFPVPRNRGAANFMRVMKDEIIPLVDRTYRTDPRERGIGGHSMGGFFTAYSLLHAADTFNRFWVSSPSLFYDDEVLFKDFKAFRRQKIGRPLYVYTNVGGDELPAMRSALERFGDKLVEAQPGRIVLDRLVVPGADHATTAFSALAPALEHLFDYRPRILPLPADMVRFSGQYQLPAGTVITFITDGSGLLFRDSSVEYETGSLVPLFASAPNRFYRRGLPDEYEFPSGSEIPQRVRVINRATGEVIEAVRRAPQDRWPIDPLTIGRP